MDGQGSAGSSAELGTEVGGSSRLTFIFPELRDTAIFLAAAHRKGNLLYLTFCSENDTLLMLCRVPWQILISKVLSSVTCRKKTCHRRGVPKSLHWEIPGCCRPCPSIEPSCEVLETLRLTPLAPSLSLHSCLASGVSLRPTGYLKSFTKRVLTKEGWKKMLLSAYQAWLCYPQKSLSFVNFILV